ncbi:N-acetylglucosamine-6-phosphate deacetylase [Komagataeibacter nataicola]|uniref:N-acetylglucosamine-6-phosphate deacetylase n=1 Tax=Komagataeibacter nataicola TaxID=265960 RepID=A0A9N7CT78_9PROT|nr:N-acetylglucosamine-6-phosphate deacetylase [Komagataeibacter nataicola]AQU88686.1 N-acetylglucosamine-6-phosphate deacetylase [Komagataeibacter nataicola]PYD66685.1 N-acetylglucosamine-6-phosphate deacetylase [Komagataeibacter nataicola]WEQ57063.1 N-acetylglucosamine-6-phosphate deacetylase [Komagataeibacter nataicola]WNM08596.1 N-acetylglucosamine-6-phosphate deacetylase [Komagataeibacter nataicola]GBR26145.1 N-acetylglucosamine-6-phosphate deacetylase [Komagataeibacter nataicola NRIC 061
MNISGQLVCADQILPGTISFDTLIGDISARPDAPQRYILPGFIDGHVHGGDGADTMDGVDAIRRMSRFHLSHGTTTILPTTITRPWSDVMDALRAVVEVRRTGNPNGPCIHGAHLEGPFVSPHRLGAQPPFAITPDPEHVTQALSLDIVRVVTLAPELEHADTAIDAFARAGVRISLGHSVADYEGARQAICRICTAGGVTGATHLFNAMNPIEGRRPGPVTALMCSDATYAEMIYDTHHVHPASFHLARQMMGSRLLFVTDAMRGAGMGEGQSQLGGQTVHIANGTARLENGTLAGSILTLDVALRNAVQAGASLPQAAGLVSGNAARYLGLSDRGELTVGRRADFVVLDRDLHIEEVWVAGQRLH